MPVLVTVAQSIGPFVKLAVIFCIVLPFPPPGGSVGGFTEGAVVSTLKSASFGSVLPPNETHPLVPPLTSFTLACQWYDVLVKKPEQVTSNVTAVGVT